MRMPAGCLDQEIHQVPAEAGINPGPPNLALVRLRVLPLGHTFAKHKVLSPWHCSPSWWLDSKYPRVRERGFFKALEEGILWNHF